MVNTSSSLHGFILAFAMEFLLTKVNGSWACFVESPVRVSEAVVVSRRGPVVLHPCWWSYWIVSFDGLCHRFSSQGTLRDGSTAQ
jgi:hypothetical protein